MWKPQPILRNPPRKPMEGGGTPCVVHSDHLHGLCGHLHKPMVGGGGTPCVVHGDHPQHGLRDHLHPNPQKPIERRKDTAHRAQLITSMACAATFPETPSSSRSPRTQDLHGQDPKSVNILPPADSPVAYMHFRTHLCIQPPASREDPETHSKGPRRERRKEEEGGRSRWKRRKKKVVRCFEQKSTSHGYHMTGHVIFSCSCWDKHWPEGWFIPVWYAVLVHMPVHPLLHIFWGYSVLILAEFLCLSLSWSAFWVLIAIILCGFQTLW